MRWPALALVALATLVTGLPAPPNAPQCASPACKDGSGGHNEYQYYIHDQPLIVSHWPGSLALKCQGAALEPAALPAFTSRAVLSKLRVAGCELPGAGLAAVLRAFNARLSCTARLPCRLTLELPANSSLGARHLAGLAALAQLSVSAPGAAPAAAEPGFLEPLRALDSLELLHVIAPPAAEWPPPPTLRRLQLRDAGPAPAALPALHHYWLESAGELDVAVPDVTEFVLISNATKLRLTDAPPSLSTLLVVSWTERAPVPLARCPELRSLTLMSPALEALPEGWLAACTRLEELVVQDASRLHVLPAGLLVGAHALSLLELSGSALGQLPLDAHTGTGLLHAVPALRELRLHRNRMRALPSNVFAASKQLEKLDLADNSLEQPALAELAALSASLHELNLSRNPGLRDFCSSREDSSALRELVKLRKLELAGTGATLVCRDWRLGMRGLRTLDLSGTNITELWFQDLQNERDVAGARVLLQGARVHSVITEHADLAAPRPDALYLAKVELNVTLACDCNMYWTRRALDRLEHVVGLSCAAAGGARRLRDVSPEDMQCAAPAECAAFPELPASCSCSERPAAERASVVRLRCERAGLTRVPRPAPRALRRYHLQLAHNNITRLEPEDLFPELESLDLRHNGLKTVAVSAVPALEAVPALLLADDSLDCSCGAATVLKALQRRLRAGAELAELACGPHGGGGPAVLSPAAACAPPEPRVAVALAAGLAALLALALAVLAALASRERRLLLKALLLRWGLLWRGEPTEDAERPYDAFVTFSHEDEAAALALVARLEPAYRLCVHYRDWTPGRLIAEQVQESVARSRRTLALVSRNFLRSAWACAEFRSAHAAALRSARHRLVVVLLEEPSRLPHDARLQAYLATNTYVRWTDPWLWDKLRVALPPPRAPVSVPDPAATPPCPKPAASPPCATPNVSPPGPTPTAPSPCPTPAVPSPLSIPTVSSTCPTPAVPSPLSIPTVSSTCPTPAVPSPLSIPTVSSTCPTPAVPSPLSIPTVSSTCPTPAVPSPYPTPAVPSPYPTPAVPPSCPTAIVYPTMSPPHPAGSVGGESPRREAPAARLPSRRHVTPSTSSESSSSSEGEREGWPAPPRTAPARPLVLAT